MVIIILQIARVCYDKDKKKRKEPFNTCNVKVHIKLTSTETSTLEVNMNFLNTEHIEVVSLVHYNELRPRGRGFEPQRRHRVVSLSKTHKS